MKITIIIRYNKYPFLFFVIDVTQYLTGHQLQCKRTDT